MGDSAVNCRLLPTAG